MELTKQIRNNNLARGRYDAFTLDEFQKELTTKVRHNNLARGYYAALK